MIVLYWSVEYFATLVETILCCILAKIFIKSESVNDKNSKTRMFVYSCLASVIVMTVNKMELFSFINGILGIIMLFSLQCIIYRQRYNILLLSTLIYAVIDSAIDFVIAQMGGILMSLKISYLLNEQSLERCGCVFISKLILCILIYLIYKYNYEKVDIPKKYIVVICFIAIILVALDYYTIEKSIVSDSQDIRLFSVIFFFFSIVMIIVMFDLVLKLAENYQQKQELALLELQNEMNVKAEKNTEQTFNLWRSSIHDYKHKVLVIKHWLDEGKIEELKDFIENESETLAQKIYYIKTGNEVVDAIINTKQNLAEKKGINFSVNVKIPPECIVSDIDFVCIFGNLIDNAIEACETQSEKRIEIIVKEIKKLLIIKVINSYKGKLPDKLSTTKKEKRFHGIGLKNVKSILEKYDGTYQMIKEDDEVITKIMILNKKR